MSKLDPRHASRSNWLTRNSCLTSNIDIQPSSFRACHPSVQAPRVQQHHPASSRASSDHASTSASRQCDTFSHLGDHLTSFSPPPAHSRSPSTVRPGTTPARCVTPIQHNQSPSTANSQHDASRHQQHKVQPQHVPTARGPATSRSLTATSEPGVARSAAQCHPSLAPRPSTTTHTSQTSAGRIPPHSCSAGHNNSDVLGRYKCPENPLRRSPRRL